MVKDLVPDRSMVRPWPSGSCQASSYCDHGALGKRPALVIRLPPRYRREKFRQNFAGLRACERLIATVVTSGATAADDGSDEDGGKAVAF